MSSFDPAHSSIGVDYLKLENLFGWFGSKIMLILQFDGYSGITINDGDGGITIR